MPTNNFYPSVSNLISASQLPLDKIPFTGDLIALLDLLFYRNLLVSKSAEGDVGFYALEILSYKEIGFDIPGTEMKFLINPDLTPGGAATTFPVSFNYQWPILKVVRDFKYTLFSGNPTDYFNLMSKYLGITYTDIIDGVIQSFISTNNIQRFVNEYNTKHPSDILSVPATGSFDEDIDELAIQLDTKGIDVQEILFNDFISNSNLQTALDNIVTFFKSLLTNAPIADFEKLLKPSFQVSLKNLSCGISFPEEIFKPVNPSIQKSKISFNLGSLSYSTEDGFSFQNESSFSFTKSEILGTGFTLGIKQMKLDLSRKNNIPEAIADNRPDDFVGVYVTEGTIGFPSFLNHDDANSTAELFVNNLLVGTEGISGTIGMQLKSGQTGTPELKNSIGNFNIEFNAFSLTFQQNSIIGSNIAGTLTLPSQFEQSGSSATITVQAAFANNGDFSLTASSATGIDIEIPNVLTIKIYELSLGELNDKFYIKINGALKITADPAGFQLMEDFVPVPGIIIWEDGSLEIEGGRIPIPNAFELKLGPTTISITAIDYGTAERNQRQYSYFGFSGGLDMSPGGVDVQGNGIKYFYTTDSGTFKHFLELDQIDIDIHLPAHMNPKDAKINISGFLSISNPTDNSISGDPNFDQDHASGNPSKEYMGSVAFLIRLAKDKGEISGGAAMRLRPKEPAFVVDAFMEMNKPIPLATTGLGIYGFRGLLGYRFLPSKTAAGVDEDSTWWNYYKAPPRGVSVSKFAQKEGFSVGAGIALATAEDDGYAFSSKLMLILGLPDILILTGQADVLNKRIRYTDTVDPPISAIMAVTKESVEVGLGAHYLLPKGTGGILDVYAEAEIAYFFNNPKAWYIYMLVGNFQ